MMDFKVVRQVVVFALVFTMLAKHQVWGEIDCHDEKVSVMLNSGAKPEIFCVGVRCIRRWVHHTYEQY